jgi:hypothetical protein
MSTLTKILIAALALVSIVFIVYAVKQKKIKAALLAANLTTELSLDEQLKQLQARIAEEERKYNEARRAYLAEVARQQTVGIVNELQNTNNANTGGNGTSNAG